MLFTVNWIVWLVIIPSNLDESFGIEEPTQPCMNQFEYQLGVIQKLAWLDGQVQSLLEWNRVATGTIEIVTRDLKWAKLSANGSTYIRWGRTVCPEGASLVYQGYAAGGHNEHGGSGANRLCLTNKPSWNQFTDTFLWAEDIIYGTEYQIHGFDTLESMLNQDVPCSVCRVPRSDILMIPGTNVCPPNYNVEYTGYVMSGHHSHAGPSEFICVDDAPESLKGGAADISESLLYLVQASCGSLKCPPYVHGRELTCAVCSYSFTNSNHAAFNSGG